MPDIGDPELEVTVSNLFDSASLPERVHVGIGHSIPFKNKKQIDAINKKFNKYPRTKHCFINIYRSRGVSYGRKAAISNYDNQDFYLQIDSHTLFSDQWDQILIDLFYETQKENNNGKTILTAYLPPYQYSSKNKRTFPRGKKGAYPYYVSGIELESGMNEEIIKSWSEWYPEIPMWMMPNLNHEKHYHFIKDRFVKSRKMCANFIFSTGQFAKDFDKILPIDIFFFEEEYIMSIEAHHMGYNFIYPNVELPLGHLYTDEYNEFYPGRPSVEWELKSHMITRKNFEDYIGSSRDKIKSYADYAGLTYPDMKTVSVDYIPEWGAA